MSLERALNRTVLLMQDHVWPDTPPEVLLEALCTTEIAIVADSPNLVSSSAQSAIVAAASLVGRSGGVVYLDLPSTPLRTPQPPLRERELCAGLVELGRDLLPGRTAIYSGRPDHEVDLAVVLGDSEWRGRSQRVVRLNAEPWTAMMRGGDEAWRWPSIEWPFGGLGAAALAAGEAFKIAMRKVSAFAGSAVFNETFAPSVAANFNFAPADTPFVSELGRVDIVSAGAICHTILFVLARLPSIAASLRVMDGDVTEDSNLNRYMLLRVSELALAKVRQLANLSLEGVRFCPVGQLFDSVTADELKPLAPRVMVGADHIPTRWAVQEESPQWLCVGATSHYSAMASFHAGELPCAGCLHPRDDVQDGPIPTVAFVSFWAGLMTSALLVRELAAIHIANKEQHTYFTPLRPETTLWVGPVQPRRDCPVRCLPSSQQ